jgi:N-methylhydantoinase B
LLTDFYSGATRLSGRFTEGLLLRRSHSRTREGSPGVNGGARSPAQTLFRVGEDGRRDVIGGFAADGSWHKCVFGALPFLAGEAYEVSATGGGGWGDPFRRPADKVLDDVLNGYVSLGAALELYGVVIDEENMCVDEELTRRERSSRGANVGESNNEL